MATKEISALMQLAGGVEAEWNLLTVPIPEGILAYAIDTKKFKLGDGATLFRNLPVFFDATKMGTVTDLMNNFPDPSAAQANKFIVVNEAGTGYVISDISTDDLVKASDLADMLAAKAPASHTHALSDVVGLKSAATKDAGNSPGNVPVIQPDGKLLSDIVPPVTADDMGKKLILAYLLTAQLQADDKVALNLPNGFVDAYEDTSRIDASASVNETHDVDKYTGTNLELVSTAEELTAVPTESMLYLNTESDGIANKNIVAEVSRDDGVTWAAVALDKQRMSTDTIDVLSGMSNFDKTMAVSTKDITSPTIFDVKGSITELTVEEANYQGYFDAAIDPKYAGYIVTTDGGDVVLLNIANDGTGSREITFLGELAIGTHAVTAIKGIYINEGMIKTNASQPVVEFEEGDFWTTDSHTSLLECSAVAVDDKVYFYGGYFLDGVNNNILRIYDMKTKKWTMSYPNTEVSNGGTDQHTMVHYNNKLYFYGGNVRSTSSITNALYEYDISTKTWSTLTANNVDPNGRRAHTAVAHDGKIYQIGGYNDIDEYTYNIYIYDIATDTWSASADNPNSALGIHGHTSVVYGGKIYSYGGKNPPGFYNTMHVYDISEDSWSMGTANNLFTAGIRSHGAVVIGDKMYCYGGYNNPGTTTYYNHLHIYDFIGDTWSSGRANGNDPSGRGYFAYIAYNDEMYIYNGKEDNDIHNVSVYNPRTNSWRTECSTITGGNSVQMELYNEKLYQYGGYHLSDANVANGLSNWIIEYDLKTKIVTKRAENPYDPAGRYLHNTVLVGDKIYIYGGYDGSTYFNTLHVYDITNDTYTELTANAADTNGRRNCVVEAYNGKLYFYAGYDDVDNVDLNSLHIYDIATDTWSIGAANTLCPNGSRIATSSILGDKIYVYGGFNSTDSYLNEMYIYDITNGTWSEGTANSESGVYTATSAIYDGNMYIFGGYDGSEVVNRLSIYDISADSWLTTKTNPIHGGRNSHGMVLYGDKLIIHGGNTEDGRYGIDGLLIYDITEDEWWSTESPDINGRYSHATVQIGKYMYMYGGFSTIDGNLNSLVIYDMEKKLYKYGAANTNDTLGRRLIAYSGIAYDNKIYIYGGFTSGSSYLNSLHIYDTVTDTWSVGTPNPNTTGIRSCSAVLHGDTIYYYGGQDVDTVYNHLHAYDITGDTWSIEAPNTNDTSGRCGHAAAVYNNKMYVYGGQFVTDYTNTLHIYDLVAGTWSVGTPNATIDPDGRGYYGTYLKDGVIYIMNGYDNVNEYRTDCCKYDIAEDTWSSVLGNFRTGYGHSSMSNGCLYQDIAFFYGGVYVNVSTISLNDMEYYTTKIKNQVASDWTTTVAILDWTEGISCGIFLDGNAVLSTDYCAVLYAGEYQVYSDLMWKSIAKDNEGTWQYLDGTGTWQDASSNSAIVAVTEALAVEANQVMTVLQFQEIKATIISEELTSALAISMTDSLISRLQVAELTDATIPDGTMYRYKISALDDLTLTVHSVRVSY